VPVRCRTGYPGRSRAVRLSIPSATAAIIAKPSNAGLAEFGWEEKRALQGREIDGRYHGVAVACFIEGGGAGPKETARLDLEADGTVSVYVGSTAVGQDLETVMAQIAADTLGLPLGQVRVLHGSTPLLDEGYGAFASRSTVLGGSAVFEAANALIARIRAAAGAAGLRRRKSRSGRWMRPRSRRALARVGRVGGRQPAGHDGVRQRQPDDLHLRIGRET
jgi:CO/xanthine dehydrogenase Mo-binding subunit